MRRTRPRRRGPSSSRGLLHVNAQGGHLFGPPQAHPAQEGACSLAVARRVIRADSAPSGVRDRDEPPRGGLLEEHLDERLLVGRVVRRAPLEGEPRRRFPRGDLPGLMGLRPRARLERLEEAPPTPPASPKPRSTTTERAWRG